MWFTAGFPPKVISQNPDLVAPPSADDVALAFPDVECFIARIDAIRAFDRRANLGKITAPTLITCARDDVITPIHFSEELVALIPGAKADFIETGAHFYPMLEAEAFRTQVLKHFSP